MTTTSACHLPLELGDVLIPRVLRVTATNRSVTVTFEVRSVGHGGDALRLRIRVPLNASRELSEHVQAAWKAATEGRYPSNTGDRDRLAALALGGDSGPGSLHATFSVFTPHEHRGPPPGLTWDMFTTNPTMDGGVVDRVLDEHFDWGVDCSVLSGTVPLASLSADDVDIDDVLGDLSGSRVAPCSVPSEAIESVDARDVFGVLQRVVLSDASICADHVAHVSASKIQLPALRSRDWASAILLSSCSGIVQIDSIPEASLSIDPGLDAGKARGSIGSDMLFPESFAGTVIASVATSALCGPIAGRSFRANSIPPWALARRVNADILFGELASQGTIMSRSMRTPACVAGSVRVVDHVTVKRRLRTRAIDARRVGCTDLRALGRVDVDGNMACPRVIARNDLLPTRTVCEETCCVSLGSLEITSDLLRWSRLHTHVMRVAKDIHSDELRVQGAYIERRVSAGALDGVAMDGVCRANSGSCHAQAACFRKDVRSSQAALGENLDVLRSCKAVHVACNVVRCTDLASVATRLACKLSMHCGIVSVSGAVVASQLDAMRVSVDGNAESARNLRAGAASVVRAHVATVETGGLSVRSTLTMRSCDASSWASRQLSCLEKTTVREVVHCGALGASQPIQITGRAEMKRAGARGVIETGVLAAERVACSAMRCRSDAAVGRCEGGVCDVHVNLERDTRIVCSANVRIASSDVCDACSVTTRSTRTTAANATRVDAQAVQCHTLVAKSGLDVAFHRLSRLAATLDGIGA